MDSAPKLPVPYKPNHMDTVKCSNNDASLLIKSAIIATIPFIPILLTYLFM